MKTHPQLFHFPILLAREFTTPKVIFKELEFKIFYAEIIKNEIRRNYTVYTFSKLIIS